MNRMKLSTLLPPAAADPAAAAAHVADLDDRNDRFADAIGQFLARIQGQCNAD